MQYRSFERAVKSPLEGEGYTEKQWGRPCTELPAFIIKRLPVRFTFDNNYFNVLYQGIPIGGYTKMVERMLEGVEVRLGVDYLDNKEELDKLAEKVIYTDAETPFTRIIEHKWFEFGKDKDGNELPQTVISREYSSEWKPGDEPYYPVNDEKNNALYEKYKQLTAAESNVIFGGRLGEYKYYDMDAVIAVALDLCEKELG